VTFDKTSKEFILKLDNELGIYDIRYTLDGSIPDVNSKIYSAPMRYATPINLYAQAFRKGEPIGFPLKKVFSTGFSDKCKVSYTTPYDTGYSGGGDQALFNNTYANPRGDDPNWQGIPQKDFEVTIDLGESNTLSYIALNFFQHIASTSVMLPTEVMISTSEDGVNFKTVLNKTLETIKERDPFIKKIETEFKKQAVSFIKVTAKNRGQLPQWHILKGDAWIFVDEVTVK
jgi:hexosaminidase